MLRFLPTALSTAIVSRVIFFAPRNPDVVEGNKPAAKPLGGRIPVARESYCAAIQREMSGQVSLSVFSP